MAILCSTQSSEVQTLPPSSIKNSKIQWIRHLESDRVNVEEWSVPSTKVREEEKSLAQRQKSPRAYSVCYRRRDRGYMKADGWKGGYCWGKTGKGEYNKTARLKGSRINSDNLSRSIVMDKLLFSKLLQNPSGCKTRLKCGFGYIRTSLEDLLLPLPNQWNHTNMLIWRQRLSMCIG